MFDYRQYIDIYYNNVSGGFIGQYAALELLKKSRRLAEKVADRAYTTEVVIYAVLYFDTETSAWLAVDLLNCRISYSGYREIVADLPEGFRFYCVKGRMEEMYDD